MEEMWCPWAAGRREEVGQRSDTGTAGQGEHVDGKNEASIQRGERST